jgi:hypothetical protein
MAPVMALETVETVGLRRPAPSTQLKLGVNESTAYAGEPDYAWFSEGIRQRPARSTLASHFICLARNS